MQETSTSSVALLTVPEVQQSPAVHGRGIEGAASSQPLQVIEAIKILTINKKQFSVPDMFTENVNSLRRKIFVSRVASKLP